MKSEIKWYVIPVEYGEGYEAAEYKTEKEAKDAALSLCEDTLTEWLVIKGETKWIAMPPPNEIRGELVKLSK